eukprot:jgi/Bigna1/89493/estExt_fgenesh1_pg.C_500064
MVFLAIRVYSSCLFYERRTSSTPSTPLIVPIRSRARTKASLLYAGSVMQAARMRPPILLAFAAFAFGVYRKDERGVKNDAIKTKTPPISATDQELFNRYMRGLFRIQELNELIDDRRTIVDDMDIVNDHWYLAEGTWNPRILLGKCSVLLSPSKTREIIDRKQSRAIRDTEVMDRERRKLLTELQRIKGMISATIQPYIDLEEVGHEILDKAQEALSENAAH